MEALEELFRAAGIPFCRFGNRIRLVTLIYEPVKEFDIYNNLLGVFHMS
jgi:hypothetical protein